MSKAQREYSASTVFVANPSDEDLYAAQKGCCLSCRAKIDPQRHSKENPSGYTRDHIFPRSRGNTLLGNKVLVCQPCNVQKGNAAPTAQYLHRALTLYMQLMSQDMIELLRRQAHPLFASAPEARIKLAVSQAPPRIQPKESVGFEQQAWARFWRRYQQRVKTVDRRIQDGVEQGGALYLVVNKDNHILTRLDECGRAYFAVGRPNDLESHLCDLAQATERMAAYNASRPTHLPSCKLIRVDHFAQSQQDRARQSAPAAAPTRGPRAKKGRLRFTALSA